MKYKHILIIWKRIQVREFNSKNSNSNSKKQKVSTKKTDSSETKMKFQWTFSDKTFLNDAYINKVIY